MQQIVVLRLNFQVGLRNEQ